MNNQEFLNASRKGDLETVRQLLSNKKIDINCKDINNTEKFIIFKSNFFMILKF